MTSKPLDSSRFFLERVCPNHHQPTADDSDKHSLVFWQRSESWKSTDFLIQIPRSFDSGTSRGAILDRLNLLVHSDWQSQSSLKIQARLRPRRFLIRKSLWLFLKSPRSYLAGSLICLPSELAEANSFGWFGKFGNPARSQIAYGDAKSEIWRLRTATLARAPIVHRRWTIKFPSREICENPADFHYYVRGPLRAPYVYARGQKLRSASKMPHYACPKGFP